MDQKSKLIVPIPDDSVFKKPQPVAKWSKHPFVFSKSPNDRESSSSPSSIDDDQDDDHDHDHHQEIVFKPRRILPINYYRNYISAQAFVHYDSDIFFLIYWDHIPILTQIKMLRKIVEKILNIEIVGSFDQQSRLTDDHTLLGYESNKQSNSSIGFIISEKYYLDFQPINGNRKFIINRPPFISVQNSILEPSTILTSKKLQGTTVQYSDDDDDDESLDDYYYDDDDDEDEEYDESIKRSKDQDSHKFKNFLDDNGNDDDSDDDDGDNDDNGDDSDSDCDDDDNETKQIKESSNPVKLESSPSSYGNGKMIKLNNDDPKIELPTNIRLTDIADENDENNLNQTKQKSNGLKFKIRRIYQIDLTNPGSFSYGKYEIINLTDENVNDSNGNLEQEIIQIEESDENVNDSNGNIEQEVILIDESDDYSNIEQESLSSSSSYGKSKKMKLNNKPIDKLAKNNTESIPVITLDSDSD